MDDKHQQSSREKARKASRELIKARNDTSGGGKVCLMGINWRWLSRQISKL